MSAMPSCEEGNGGRKREAVESTSSLDSSIAGKHARQADVGASRRKATKPVKLWDLKKNLSVNSDGRAIMAHYAANMDQRVKNCRFRVGNVVSSMRAKARMIKVEERTMPDIYESLDGLLEQRYRECNHRELFSVNFNRILSWGGNDSDRCKNFATDAASVQSFTVIVDNDDNVKVIPHGLSSVSFKVVPLSRKLSKNASNMKDITLTGRELEEAKYIYLAAVVRRMIPITERPQSSRNSNGSCLLDPATLKQEVGVGCIRMFENGKPFDVNHGVQRMILVRQDQNPAKDMLGAVKESDPLIGWMKSASNLVTLNELNINRRDAHEFRMVFEIYRSWSDDAGSQPQPRAENVQSSSALDKKGQKDYFTARFPFVKVRPGGNNLDSDKDYFEEGDKITHICNWMYFNPPHKRTVVIKQRAASESESADEEDKDEVEDEDEIDDVDEEESEESYSGTNSNNHD